MRMNDKDNVKNEILDTDKIMIDSFQQMILKLDAIEQSSRSIEKMDGRLQLLTIVLILIAGVAFMVAIIDVFHIFGLIGPIR